ncbi:MAG: UvrD-helicase domain-containing protein, partial [Burkholderiaceae bacterium]|nr:UvrD-helicase domain-containing protein [Burkholderiaceae bacterium]
AVSDPFCVAYAARVADPDRALRDLRVALSRIDEAQVRTIHSFCHRVITEHAMSIGLARGLRAQALGTEWIERGLAAWWRDSIAGSSPALLALLHGQRVSPASLLRPVATIDARPAARVAPAPFDWRDLPRQIADLRGELAAVLAADGEQLLAWVGVKGNANGNTMRPDHVRARLAALAAFAGAESGLSPEIPASVEQFSGEYIAQSGRYQVPALALIGLCEQLDALRRQCLSLAGVVAHEAALALSRRRLELKAARGSIDHDDLLRIVRDALARPDGGEQFAASLRARYPVALIDECQDTDALQWEIFSRIYRPGNIGDDDSDDGDSANDRARRARDAPALILVGDPKQSIYSFRAADVYSYLEARGAGPACHGLHENQRSVPAMLDALNALFARDAPFLVREIGFSPAGAGSKARADFVDRRADERGAITVFSLDPAHGDAGAGMSGAMLARPEGVRRAVAATVAEIARLLSPDEALLAGRALGPADIAVLVNSHHEGGLVKRALQAAGIGAAEISRNSVLESRECDELLRVIAAIASPFDAGLVRGALATMLIDSLATAADEAGAPRALALLVAARSCWASAGPQAALWGLFSALDAYRRLATVRDGERRLTNLA